MGIEHGMIMIQSDINRPIYLFIYIFFFSWDDHDTGMGVYIMTNPHIRGLNSQIFNQHVQ